MNRYLAETVGILSSYGYSVLSYMNDVNALGTITALAGVFLTSMMALESYRRWFIRYNADPGTIKPGEYYTITFWAKMGVEPFNDNFNRFVIDIGDVRETATEVTIDTSDKTNLKEYSYTIKVPEYAKPANFIDFSWESVTGDMNDYIFFDKMSLENNRFKGKYIKTEGAIVIEQTLILGN